jgi:hypothetical protein
LVAIEIPEAGEGSYQRQDYKELITEHQRSYSRIVVLQRLIPLQRLGYFDEGNGISEMPGKKNWRGPDW